VAPFPCHAPNGSARQKYSPCNGGGGIKMNTAMRAVLLTSPLAGREANLWSAGVEFRTDFCGLCRLMNIDG
jgi:hypothetical protein